MKKPASFFASALMAVALAPAALADGLNPGSVLVYPIHRSQTGLASGGAFFTIVCVTNTNLQPITPINGLGGSTSVHYEYVNRDVANGSKGSKYYDCTVVDRIEFLTPADTKCVLTNCHNASTGQEGYLVVSAQDPNQFNVAWSHNYLVGSELVITAGGANYALNAIPFKALSDPGEPTDADGDGQLDFDDDMEYEGIPDELYIDSFLAIAGNSLVLINMTGGFQHTANVAFDVWNDDEFPLSATLAFKCWKEGPMTDISQVFDESFLRDNTPNDETELDIDCDNLGDLETGWARIRGLNASSVTESIPDPALLGAIADGFLALGGRRLWESEAKQTNGDFFKTGTDDPEN